MRRRKNTTPISVANTIIVTKRNNSCVNNSTLIISIIITSVLLLLFCVMVFTDSNEQNTKQISVSKIEKKRSKKSKKSVALHKGHKTQFQDSSYTKISSSDFWDKTKCSTEFSYSTICGDFKFSQCHVGISKQLHVPEKNWKHKGVTGYSFVVFESVITNVSNSATEVQVPNLITRRGDEILYFNPIIVWEDLELHTGYKLNPEFYNRITIIYQIPEKYTQQFAFIYFDNLFSIRGLKVDSTTIYKNDTIVIKNVK